MKVIWDDVGTGNRFANKHLHILMGAESIKELVDEGMKIFNARRSVKTNKAAKAQYGGTRPPANTLLVLSFTCWKQLEQKIIAANGNSQIYDIPSGAIFVSSFGPTNIGVAAKVNLHIRPHSALDTCEVFHLENTTITKYFMNTATDAMKSQMHLQSFMPGAEELQTKKLTLKRLMTNACGGIVVGPPVAFTSESSHILSAMRAAGDEAEETV